MEKYADFHECGRGAYSVVYRATEQGRDKPVAIKVFHNASPEITKSALREARFLSECSHTNIIQLKEALQSGSGRVYLVLSFAPHVLSYQIKSHKNGLPPVAVRSIIFQLLAALQHLHSKGIMHRDIKPANCLITDDGVLKLCDFGFARHVEGREPVGEESTLTPYVTTRWYRAPEVLLGQDYGTAVDIWAVGCIFAEMLTGRALFPGNSAVHQLNLQHAGVGLGQQQLAAFEAQTCGGTMCEKKEGVQNVFDSLASVMTPTMMQFLKACLQADPARRATADELLKTAFVREGAWDAPTPEKPVSTARHGKQHSKKVDVPQNPEGLQAKQQAGEGASIKSSSTEQSSARLSDDNLHAAGQRATKQNSHDGDRTSAQSTGSSGGRSVQRVVPTVRQRTAQQVAEAAGSDDDPGGDHPVVLERLQQLPPGEALSDSDSEDESPPVASTSPVQPAVQFQLPPRYSVTHDVPRLLQQGGEGVKKLHTSFAAQRKGKGQLLQSLSSAGDSSGPASQMGLSGACLSGDVATAADGSVSTNRLSAHDSSVVPNESHPDAEAGSSRASCGLKPGKHTVMSALHRSVAMPYSASSNSLLGSRHSRNSDSHTSVCAHITQAQTTEPSTAQEVLPPNTAQMAAAAITRATTEAAPVTRGGWMSCRSDGRLLRPSDLLECPPPPCTEGTDSPSTTPGTDRTLLPTKSVGASVIASKAVTNESLWSKEQLLKTGVDDGDVRMSSPLRAGIMAWNRNSGLGTRLSTPTPPRAAPSINGRFVSLQHDSSMSEAQGTQRQHQALPSPMASRTSRRLQVGTPQVSCSSAPGSQLGCDTPDSPAAATAGDHV